MQVRHFRPAVRPLAEDPALAFPSKLRFHDLRHTCAAILIGQGMEPEAIQDRLGHASIRTTLDRYGHLFEGHDGELLERLESFANGDEMRSIWKRCGAICSARCRTRMQPRRVSLWLRHG